MRIYSERADALRRPVVPEAMRGSDEEKLVAAPRRYDTHKFKFTVLSLPLRQRETCAVGCFPSCSASIYFYLRSRPAFILILFISRCETSFLPRGRTVLYRIDINMESAAVVAGARSSSSGGVDPERDLAEVAEAIDEVEQAIKQVEQKIRRVEEALESGEAYLRMEGPRLQDYLIEEKKQLRKEKQLLMEEKKQLREEKSKLLDRQRPGFGGAFFESPRVPGARRRKVF